MEEFHCLGVDCGRGDVNKHDPGRVIEVLECEVLGQAEHITY